MTKGWRITDANSNSLGTQAWDDAFGPVLLSGQKAAPFSTAGSIVFTGTLTALNATSGTLSLGNIVGAFNVSVWGTFVASVQLERSFDGGTTWIAVAVDSSGTAEVLTVPASVEVTEVEQGVLYRLNCTAYTSGTVNWRVSK